MFVWVSFGDFFRRLFFQPIFPARFSGASQVLPRVTPALVARRNGVNPHLDVQGLGQQFEHADAEREPAVPPLPQVLGVDAHRPGQLRDRAIVSQCRPSAGMVEHLDDMAAPVRHATIVPRTPVSNDRFKRP